MNISRLTSKYQATIPKQIREFLKLGKGDSIQFGMENGRVWVGRNRRNKPAAIDITRLTPAEQSLAEERLSDDDEKAFLQLQAHSLTEWSSPQDDDLLPPWPRKPLRDS